MTRAIKLCFRVFSEWKHLCHDKNCSSDTKMPSVYGVLLKLHTLQTAHTKLICCLLLADFFGFWSTQIFKALKMSSFFCQGWPKCQRWSRRGSKSWRTKNTGRCWSTLWAPLKICSLFLYQVCMCSCRCTVCACVYVCLCVWRGWGKWYTTGCSASNGCYSNSGNYSHYVLGMSTHTHHPPPAERTSLILYMRTEEKMCHSFSKLF